MPERVEATAAEDSTACGWRGKYVQTAARERGRLPLHTFGGEKSSMIKLCG